MSVDKAQPDNDITARRKDLLSQPCFSLEGGWSLEPTTRVPTQSMAVCVGGSHIGYSRIGSLSFSPSRLPNTGQQTFSQPSRGRNLYTFSVPFRGKWSERNTLQLSVKASGRDDLQGDRDNSLGSAIVQEADRAPDGSLDCVATGSDVQCHSDEGEEKLNWAPSGAATPTTSESPTPALQSVLETLLLISPFFFWGTAMVAMKDVLPKAGPLFVAAIRLIPAGGLLVAFAAYRGRKMPSTPTAWLAISLFAIVDASCFQGFLAQGLQRTSAGLGSVIIDSQPLTVALLASFLFGETIGPLGALGLVTGVLGLCLLEIPVDVLLSFVSTTFSGSGSMIGGGGGEEASFSLWEKGEWWMLLSAQSMAVGTVMFRWVCKYNDPIMATGWHMIIGGLPLLLLSAQQQDPALMGHLGDLSLSDWTSLLYTSLFGSAVSYGVFFYNASKGNLTRLSSLTFLTPMFAALFGYIYLGETFTNWQLGGAAVTVAAIFLVNAKQAPES